MVPRPGTSIRNEEKIPRNKLEPWMAVVTTFLGEFGPRFVEHMCLMKTTWLWKIEDLEFSVVYYVK